MARVREIMWFENLQRCIGPCYAYRLKTLEEVVEWTNSMNLEIFCEYHPDALNSRGCVLGRCLKFPESSLLVLGMRYGSGEIEEMYRYQPGYLHLSVNVGTFDREVTLLSSVIKTLPFSTFRLSLQRSREIFLVAPETWMKKQRHILESLGIQNKEIQVLEIGKLSRPMNPSFFPHLRIVRFLANYVPSMRATNTFTAPTPTVTRLENAWTKSLFITKVSDILSVDGIMTDFRRLYPNIETGDLTIPVLTSVPHDTIQPFLDDRLLRLQAHCPGLEIRYKEEIMET